MDAANRNDPLALDEQVCFALAAASRSVVALYRPVLEPLGLTHPQYLVMLALWERSPRRLGDVATTLRLDPATLTPIVKKLESLGLISRSRSEQDSRGVEIAPTPAGLALRERASTVPEEVVNRLGIPVERLVELREGLKELLAVTDRLDAG